MLFDDFADLDLSAEDDPPFDYYSKKCKTFIKWCKLPAEVQQCVISQMDFFTRHVNPQTYQKNPKVWFENTDYYQKGVKFFEELMKRANYSVQDCTIEMALNMLTEQVNRLALLDTDQNEDSSYRTCLTPEILSHPQIQNANQFYFWASCNFTEELFLSAKAVHMTFFSSTVNNEMINKFIKRWIKGDGPKDFVKLSIWYRNSFNKDEILKGIFHRNWDDAFDKEAGGFCDDFDRVIGGRNCAQIMQNKGKQSATLRISDDNLIFIVTGKYWEQHNICGLPKKNGLLNRWSI
ncbi:unnamed protein product [Caenorhabditis bovis]|uniref:Sdz-33 F-box domain-containing protein n=1 Tax=Caenorhabditis bovis TaxID=2654633 RepID=A0A8S1F326_9PELO|nr:unnamed protein product [Caenorhabditis bovis]